MQSMALQYVSECQKYTRIEINYGGDDDYMTSNLPDLLSHWQSLYLHHVRVQLTGWAVLDNAMQVCDSTNSTCLIYRVARKTIC
jgi:hypothetical protein